ncbi:extracellular solute-binding protein [Nonomuraea sp. NPDC050404]|uniref:ABC transporter substrate-binding protein n=1 Tax=Nonomuraea sp. NPDC050404 TaxID=3155783 RepID=UPI0034060ACC
MSKSTSPRYSRRSVLALGAAAAGAIAGGLAGCSQPSTGSSGRVELRFAYWGNAVRQKLTTQAVKVFQQTHPGIRVSLEFGQIEGYFDKLATQMAANDAPDVFQMNEKFLPEYARREALLDLKNVNVANFTPGTREPGVSNGALVGINAGVNAPTILANPAVFRAAGVDLPDDRTWTWNDLADLSARLTAARPGTRGMASMVAQDAALGVYLRQFGAALFVGDKLGFTAAHLASWFDFNLGLLKRGSVPPAAESTEDVAAPIGQRGFAQQRYAMAPDYSNLLAVYDDASGEEIRPLRYPTCTGKTGDGRLWLRASMFWSGSSRTRHPAQAQALIDFLANSNEAGEVLLAERGLPPNKKVSEHIADALPPPDQRAVDYLESIAPELGPAPDPIPAGGGELPGVLARHASEVMFGRLPSNEAAQRMVDELQANLWQ